VVINLLKKEKLYLPFLLLLAKKKLNLALFRDDWSF